MKIKDFIGNLTSRSILFYFKKTQDEIEKKRILYFTNTILLVTLFLFLLLSIIRIIIPPDINLSDYILWILEVTVAIIYLIFRKGKVNLAGLLYTITFWLTLTVLAFTFEGVRDVTIVAYILLILIAMLILKSWQALATGFISLVSLWVIFYLEHNQIIIPKPDTSINYTIELSVILVFVIVLINLNAKSYADFYKLIQKELDDRKSAEKALFDSENRFKILSSIGNEGLMIHEEGIVLEANLAFANLLGYSSPDELIGKNGFEVVNFTPESKKIVLEHIGNNSNDSYDIEIVNLNGQVIPLETKGREIVYGGRNMRLVYMHDITKRKMDEEVVIKSKALLSSIMDSTNDLIWSVDTYEYRLLTFNKGMKSLLEKAGIHIKEGILHEDIFPPESVHKLYQMYAQTLKEGSLTTMFQTTIGKRTLWINLNLLSQGGKSYAISGFAKDITELKLAEEELIKAKEKAEENDRLKTAFMKNISHEVRTPLNGILGFSQLILQPNITEEEKESYLNILNLSSERLLNTITDYMDISLIVSGNIKVHKEQLNLSRLLNEIFDLFKTKCEAKKLEFIKQMPSDNKDLVVSSDASLLKKSLSHLMDNAIKFTQGGSIFLGLNFKNNEYEIFIRDTGSGIDQEAQKKIFDYFVQAEVSDTRGYEGSGLGLSIAKGLVELMGGKIRLESVKDKGSTFFVVFPAENDIIINDDFSNKMKTQSDRNITPLILIVDDDEISQFLHKRFLDKASYKYLVARNGLEAIDLCLKNPNISLILMDIKMPEMDGLEATLKIREFRKHLPIIGTSAYATIGDREKAIDAGCNDYISKPISSSLLLSTINKHILNKRT